MQPPGKRVSRPSLSSSTAGDNNVLLIPDVCTGRRFLVDTGAEVSVFPASGADARCGSPGSPLYAANGTQIRTFGTRSITLVLCGKRYTWPFVIADVSRPLIGADFLKRHGLLVDLPHRRLLDTRPLEDLRSVILAYQQTCEEVIHRFEGQVAQYLGDDAIGTGASGASQPEGRPSDKPNDEAMLRMLEPFRGHRFRLVCMLVQDSIWNRRG